ADRATPAASRLPLHHPIQRALSSFASIAASIERTRACSATAAPVDRARRSPGQPLVWSGARHRTSVPARATMSVGCRSPEGPGLRAVARLCFDPYVYARAGVKDRRTLENEVCGTLASCRGPAQRCAGTECAR